MRSQARHLLLSCSWLLVACQGRSLRQHNVSGKSPWVCPGLDDADVLCQRDGYSVLAPADKAKNVRILRLGKACAIETQITCAGARPADQCQGGCGACPCEYNNGSISELRYLTVMADQLKPLCASPQPTKVLMIGLGGGLSTHHLLSRCPSMAIDAVDYSAAVIDMATRFFGIREAKARYTNRLQVEEADALHAVSTKAAASYDAVLVDCFIGAGKVPDNCRSQQFAEGVRRILKPSGVMMQNMWVWSPSIHTVAAEFTSTLSTYQQVFTYGAVADLHVPMPPHLDFVRVLKCTAPSGASR